MGVEEVAAPVEEVAASVEAAPVEEIAVEDEAAPEAAETVVETASSDSEPEKETASEEIFSLTEVSEKKEEEIEEVIKEVTKEPSAEEIMAIKEAKEESVTPALA